MLISPARKAGLGLAAALMVGSAGLYGCATQSASNSSAVASADASAPRVVAMRRINETQYRHAVTDIFGPVEVKGRFEPEKRLHGLLAIGAGEISISSLGFQQYYAMARQISDQMLAPKAIETSVPCKPADPKAADDACAEAFVRKYGTSLFRRTITDAEVATRVKLAHAGAAESGDFYKGLKLALTSMLTAPEFLFRYEVASTTGGKPQVDAWTRASRLSYLYWDTTPDAELLKAAADGSLMTSAGLKKQVDRLSASPRVEAGLRAMASDMMHFSMIDEKPAKNADIYPKYSIAVMEGAMEQTLRTMVDHLLVKKGDYRDLLTTRDTFINRPTAAVYKVPYTYDAAWVPYTFPQDSGRAGLQTQILFLAMFSHPGRSSPTLRGVGLNEVFLCEETPLPPADVDFSIINDSANPLLKTVRSRLLAHATDETCAGCHNLTDPIGLSLEHFDGLGQPRKLENGELIDVSSEIDGVKFAGAEGLAKVIRENPRVPACFVRTIFSYGTGRTPTDVEFADYLPRTEKAFAADGYRYLGLMSKIATSAEFYSIPGAELNFEKTEQKVASRPGSSARTGTQEAKAAREGSFKIGGL